MHAQQPIARSSSVLAVVAALLTLGAGGACADDDLWPSLQRDVFGSRPIVENDGVVQLDAPERAEDAAIVPITIRVSPSVKGQLKSMVLIIDKNPAPVAATFTFGQASGEGGGERRMSTRVRIDMYSYVHAVVETADGTLHMAKAFVKASGGCSAPAPKDADGDLADVGKTIVKSFDPGAPRNAAARGADHDQASQHQRHADGSYLARLHPGPLHQGHHRDARQRPGLPRGDRNLNHGQPELQVYVREH